MSMRYIEVGGARVSAVGLGTWQFGSPEWGYGADYDSRQANLILNRALDLGVNLIDTAEIYGFGRSEKILRRSLGSRRDACGPSAPPDSTSTNFTSRIRLFL